MILAIATEKGTVAPHFGCCGGFTILTMEGDRITERRFAESPPHEHGVLPHFLHEQGAQAVIAGGIGAGALGILREVGIPVITGATGPVEAAAIAYARGELVSREAGCDHDQHGHHDHHDHQCCH